MNPPRVKPTKIKVEGPMEGFRKKHPAFGMIRFARISGSAEKLFGSDLKDHGGIIQVEVARGDEHWSLSRKWFHAESKPLIELWMTEAQFAAAITSFNVGAGVPCTLKKTETDWNIPEIMDDSDDLSSMIKDDMKQRASEILAEADSLVVELKAALDASGLGLKKKEALTRLAERLAMQIRSNMPFMVDQFVEGTDKLKAEAYAEIDAFVTNAAMRVGFQSLRQLAAAVETELAKDKPKEIA